MVPLEATNDKLFRGIDRDPLEIVRYAKSECQAWFNANEIVPIVPQALNIEEPQVLNLGNICMIDGSLTSTAQFSEYGWVWLDNWRKVQLRPSPMYFAIFTSKIRELYNRGEICSNVFP